VEPEPGEHFQRLMEWADDVPATPGTRERRHGRTTPGARGLRRGGHRALPDGAHVLRGRPHRRGPGDDPRRGRRGPRPRRRTPAPDAAWDFEGIFRAMDGLPVTIRLLDPPLHEFLPHGAAEIKSLAKKLGSSARAVRGLVERHAERTRCSATAASASASPIPEITRMQAQAIFEAAVNVQREGRTRAPRSWCRWCHGGGASPPADHRERRRRICSPGKAGAFDFLIGTMIELPRAALTADRIAEQARVLLLRHQRPDADDLRPLPRRRRLLPPRYVEKGILPHDPFQSLDVEGWAGWCEMGTRLGREARPGLKVAPCPSRGRRPARRSSPSARPRRAAGACPPGCCASAGYMKSPP
jgi:hypothetical protein